MQCPICHGTKTMHRIDPHPGAHYGRAVPVPCEFCDATGAVASDDPVRVLPDGTIEQWYDLGQQWWRIGHRNLTGKPYAKKKVA